MSMGQRTSRAIKVWGIAAALLIAPWMAKPAAAAATESWQEQSSADREQAAQDREQEKRDREEEARDREQEKRDREQERLERLDELYSDGREALDEDRYDRAAEKFSELASLNGPQTDAAMYWKAYAENKLGKRDSALATIADLEKKYAQSRWIKDAKALEIEVKQSTGHPPNPDNQSDEDLKLLALRGIMTGNPEKGVPMAEGILNGTGKPKDLNLRRSSCWPKTVHHNRERCLHASRRVKAIRTCNAKPSSIWECSVDRSLGKHLRQSMHPRATSR